MELHFSNNSPRNAVLSNHDGQAIYKINTPWKVGSRTTTVSKIVANDDEGDMKDRFEYLAQIEWHILSSTKLMTGGNEINYKEYMDKDGALNQHRCFVAPDGRHLRWNMGFSGMAFPVLEIKDDPKTQIAKFHRRRYGIFGKKRQAYLEILDGGLHFVDQIVLTFIYVEKLRRDREEAARRSGSTGGG